MDFTMNFYMGVSGFKFHTHPMNGFHKWYPKMDAFLLETPMKLYDLASGKSLQSALENG